MPIVCIVRLPLFCLLMSQISQHEARVDRLQPHTSEILHHHHDGAVIHRHHHEYHQLIYVSTGVLAIHTEQGAWVAPGIGPRGYRPASGTSTGPTG